MGNIGLVGAGSALNDLQGKNSRNGNLCTFSVPDDCANKYDLGVKTSAELVQYALEHGMLKKYT